MAMSKKEQSEFEALRAENARLHAECNNLTMKLKGQIKRGNILKSRAPHDLPESPTFMAAAKAYCAAHPGATATREKVTAWLNRQPEPA